MKTHPNETRWSYEAINIGHDDRRTGCLYATDPLQAVHRLNGLLAGQGAGRGWSVRVRPLREGSDADLPI
jgi:hypothetical protein